MAEGRLSFHPVKNTLSYHQQKEEAKPYVRAFIQERAPRSLRHFEELLAANAQVHPASPFLVGSALTTCDLNMWVMLCVTLHQFPDDDPLRDLPRLTALKAVVETRPRINAYMQSSRRRPFAGDSLM